MYCSLAAGKYKYVNTSPYPTWRGILADGIWGSKYVKGENFQEQGGKRKDKWKLEVKRIRYMQRRAKMKAKGGALEVNSCVLHEGGFFFLRGTVFGRYMYRPLPYSRPWCLSRGALLTQAVHYTCLQLFLSPHPRSCVLEHQYMSAAALFFATADSRHLVAGPWIVCSLQTCLKNATH